MKQKISISYIEPGYKIENFTVLCVTIAQGAMGENYKCLQRLVYNSSVQKLEKKMLEVSRIEHDYNSAVMFLEKFDPRSKEYNPKLLRMLKKELDEKEKKKKEYEQIITEKIYNEADIKKMAEEIGANPNSVRLVLGKYLSDDVAKRESEIGIKESFEKEIGFQSQLQHKNIACLYDSIKTEDNWAGQWAMMEYIDGMNLSTILDYEPRLARSPKPLTPIQASIILHKIAEGLAYSHKKGIVNRDVKSSNAVLSFTNGEVKIVDWGIAVYENETVYKSASTSHYCSPEEANLLSGKVKEIVLDRKRDIFPLGIVFYELLTGYRPFEDITGDSLRNIINPNFKPKPIKRWYEEMFYKNMNMKKRYKERGYVYDKILDQLCSLMLEKDPKKRIDNAEYVIDEIESYLSKYVKTTQYNDLLFEQLAKPLDEDRRRTFKHMGNEDGATRQEISI